MIMSLVAKETLFDEDSDFYFFSSTKISRSPTVLLCEIIYIQFQPCWAAFFVGDCFLSRQETVQCNARDDKWRNLKIGEQTGGGKPQFAMGLLSHLRVSPYAGTMIAQYRAGEWPYWKLHLPYLHKASPAAISSTLLPTSEDSVSQSLKCRPIVEFHDRLFDKRD